MHIGPGIFTGTLNCTNNGYVSFIGSGVKSTTFNGNSGNAVVVTNCDELLFQDMTFTDYTIYPILWNEGGSSRWINVDVVGTLAAWHDTGKLGCGDPVHYWFNSRLSVIGAAGTVYDTECGESWFYGSELTFIASNQFFADAIIIGMRDVADVRLFGSVVRALMENPDPHSYGGFTAVDLNDNANFHMHGGIISINQSTSGKFDVKGIVNNGAGIAHTPETAFTLKPGVMGMAHRLVNSGTGSVQSPFQWPANSTPPSIDSKSGSDTFVETDCKSDGDCDSGAGTETHLMIYNDTCNTSGPWFNSVTTRCRGELPSPTSGTQPPTEGQHGDTFIETDCEPNGDCDIGTGTEAHMMIFNNYCTIGNQPWFDSTRGKCRGEL